MKRLSLFLTALLSLWMTAWAQGDVPEGGNSDQQTATLDHWTYTQGQYPNETFVYADLVVGTETLTQESEYNTYQVAAFIGEEVRAIGTVVINEAVKTNMQYLLQFRVDGDLSETGDLNKSITFKAYNKRTGLEYDLEMREEPLPTFTGESLTPGIPSSPRHLYFTPVTGITFTDVTMNVNDEEDLTTHVSFTPNGATAPNNVTFTLPEGTNYATLSGTTLKAVAPTIEGINIQVSAGTLTATNTVVILQPATSMTLSATELTVSVDTNIEELLDDLVTLSPDNTTDQWQWSWEIGETPIVDSRYTAINPGDVVFTVSVIDGLTSKPNQDVASQTVTVHVTKPVTGITTDFIGFSTAIGEFVTINCSAGDDLTPYFVDGKAFNIAPADATNKNVTFALSPNMDAADQGVTITDDGRIVASNKTAAAAIEVTSVDNPEAKCTVYIMVYYDWTTVAAAQDEFNVFYSGEDIDISETIQNGFTFGPADANYPSFANALSIVSSNPGVVEINDQGAFAKSVGTAEITVTLSIKDYLQATFSSDQDFITTKTASFTVNVTEALSGLDLEFPDSFVAGYSSNFIIKPIPTGASLGDDLDRFTITATYNDNNAWNPIEIVDLAFTDDGGVEAYADSRIPGSITITVYYDNGTDEVISVTSDPIQVGYEYEYSNGWQWHTVPYGNPDNLDLNDVYGANLVEIRTQDGHLYNDPVYGYFGDHNLVAQNTCFKLKMNDEAELGSYIYYDGQLGSVPAITLRPGWNWIPNPFFFQRMLSNAFQEAMAFQIGDRIVSKENGFVEYTANGWNGSLDVLSCGEGYMFYNASSETRRLLFNSEFMFSDNDDALPARRYLAPRHKAGYDASRFRDNMTIVAQLQDDVVSDDSHVVAYVGDECRGEGVAVGGRFFITVHGEQGDNVRFMLVDDNTGEETNIDGTLSFRTALGTVSQPVMMKKGDVVTGIKTIGTTDGTSTSFDLSGRRTSNSHSGVTIQHMKDNSVRKVVR